jgi:hypothetical protein
VARRGNPTSGARRLADMPLRRWRGTLIAAAVIVAVVGAVVGGAVTFGDLRYTSFPGHSYPPAGTYGNPFSKDRGDLVNAADAARVKAGFQADGQLEVDAFARGDATSLPQSDAGGRLATLQRLIAQNTASGIVQRYDNHVENVVVGRLAVPGSTSVAWCVQERGTATLTDVARTSGQALRTQRYRFDGRFWLARAGDRYVITDAAITTTPLAGG